MLVAETCGVYATIDIDKKFLSDGEIFGCRGQILRPFCGDSQA